MISRHQWFKERIKSCINEIQKIDEQDWKLYLSKNYEISKMSNSEFFQKYCDLHFKKLQEIFEPAKKNPVW